MRLLQLVHSLDRGGAERIVLEVDRGVRARGHHARVAMLLDSNTFTEDQYAAVQTEFLVSAQQYRWPRYVRPAAARLQQVIDDWKPDAIFTHTPDVTIVAAWARPRVPTVQVIHSHWETSSGNRLRDAWRRAVARWAFSRIGGRGIVVAPHLCDDASRYLGVSRRQLSCVENGLDLERFAFVERALVPAPRIVVVGALDARKRPDLALRAFAHLHRTLTEARLVLAGDGPMRAELERLRDSLDLSDSVELLGYRADLPAVLRECHVCWHVSRREGFGLAIAEAMATGLPVVGMDVPGVRGLLGDADADLIVADDDPAGLADRTLRLLRDDAEYREVARRGRVLAEQRFDVRRMVDGYLETASPL